MEQADGMPDMLQGFPSVSRLKPQHNNNNYYNYYYCYYYYYFCYYPDHCH